jgi:hypothetical protein
MNRRLQKGSRVSKPSSAKFGFFTSLRGGGSGAPSSRLVFAPLLASLALLALTAAPALAARGHEYLGETIGEPCTAEPCGSGELKEPSGVAVNEASGDIYVVDQGNNYAYRLDLIGAPA